MSQAQAYQGTAIDRMMNGTIYKTLGGLKPEREVGLFTPKLKFIPHRFTQWGLAGPVAAPAPYLQDKIGLGQMLPPLVTHIGLGLTGLYLFYSLFFKPAKDTFNYVEPFREKCVLDPAFSRAVDALGLLDELLALGQFARDIFYASSPRSLIILDELAEGTTYEERLHESYGISDDFHTIGNNTVLVTHNHSLVDRFMDEHKGQCLMTEFNGDEPTYRVVEGISRVSHASRIAEKINFSSTDRQRYMESNGFI